MGIGLLTELYKKCINNNDGTADNDLSKDLEGWKPLLLICLVVSDSLQPHGLQHARLPCPLLSPRVFSNSCPLNLWWHPTTSSSVAPFFSCPQSFSASGSFPMSQLFVSSDGQSTGASASAPVLPMNIQDWFPLGLMTLISAVQETFKSLLQLHSSKVSVLQCSAFFTVYFEQ